MADASAVMTPEEYLQKTSLSAMLTALLEETCKEKPNELRPFMLSFMLKTYPTSVDADLRGKVDAVLEASPWKQCTDVAPTHEGLTTYLDQIKARPTLESMLERALREQPSNVVGFVINCLLDSTTASGDGGAASAAAADLLESSTARIAAGPDENVLAAFEHVKEGDMDALSEKLDAGLDVNCRDEEQNSLLHLAAEGEPGIVEELMKRKINVNAQNRMGQTALMQAVTYEDAEIVTLLLEAGASIEQKDVDGKDAKALAEDISDETIQRALGVEVKEVAEVEHKPAARRNSVSSEVVDPKAKIDLSTIKTYEKDDATKARIRECVKESILFRAADEETLGILVDAMAETKVPAGEEIIKQGDEGNFFYIVDHGHFDCFVKAEGHELPGKKVLEYSTGGTFGELALMYNTPRAATVVASEDSLLWALDRTAFRTLLLQKMCEKRLKFEELLAIAPVISKMGVYDRSLLADAFEEKSYAAGSAIISQGDDAHQFFIVTKGSAVVKKDGTQVNQVPVAGYFGELGCLRKQPRSATVEAGADCSCAFIDQSSFLRLMSTALAPLEAQAAGYK